MEDSEGETLEEMVLVAQPLPECEGEGETDCVVLTVGEVEAECVALAEEQGLGLAE